MKKWSNGERALSDLVPYEKNPRAHTEEDITRLADAIKRFGFTAPILIDKKNRVLAGHSRCRAAFKLGMKTVPVRIIGDDWTEAEKQAYTIWDNQSTILGTWDIALLRSELIELKASDVDLGLLGFSADDLLLYTAAEPTGADPEEVPEPPKNPVSKTGDLWVLGNHRLLCGDSTKAEDVAKVLGKQKPHLMVTDPPYGVDYDPAWRAAVGVNKNHGKLGKVKNDDKIDWIDAWKLFPGEVAYIWHADRHASKVQNSLSAAGFSTVSQIIWAKDRLVLSRGDYHWQHEPCWYVVRNGKNHQWAGDRSQTTLWAIPAREDAGHGHGTQKPVECMRRPVVNNSKRGDYVYEPFGGSFTTGIACEMTGRHCLAIEIAPEYVDVGVCRWQTFASKEAVLAATGRTFTQVAAERTKKRPRNGASKSKPKHSVRIRSTASAVPSPSPSAASGHSPLPSVER